MAEVASTAEQAALILIAGVSFSLVFSISGLVARRWAERRTPRRTVNVSRCPSSTVIEPLNSKAFRALAFASLALGLAGAALTAGSSRAGLLGVLTLGLAGYFTLAALFTTTGRIGVGEVTLSDHGISQRWHGYEWRISWTEVDEVTHHHSGVLLLSGTSVTPEPLAPRIWRQRAADSAQCGLVLNLGEFHPGIDFVGAMRVWKASAEARKELGTPRSVERLCDW